MGKQWKKWETLFSWVPKSLQMMTVAMKFKAACSLRKKKKNDKHRQSIKKQRHYFADKGLYSQDYGFSSSRVWMWELDHKEGWEPKNWHFCNVVLENTLESPLDCKEIQPVHPKGNWSSMFIGKTNAEAEVPVLWSPDTKSLLIGKDPDDGKDRRQEEKGMGKDGMVGWHHQLNGYEFGWAPGDGEGQGGLACSVHGVAKSQTRLSDWTTRDNLKCVGGCVSVTCKYAILYKGLEHPWILLLTGSPWTYPPLIPRNNCNVFHDSDVTPKVVQMRRICVDS